MAVDGREFGSLDELRAYMAECQRCPLGCSRTNLVFGVGDPHADLLFIGEAPGEKEDLLGEPFVGAAGKFLGDLLASIGLTRKDVYIANVLKCRPPGNRDPQPDEISECAPYLDEQIRLIDPKVIATLGKFATQFVLKTQRGITQLRGKLYHVDGRQVVPVFHPAAALYNPNNREVLFEDFRRLRAVIDRTPDQSAEECEHGTEIEPAREDGPRVVECETPRLFDPE